jgi:hypothetical protein
MRNRLWAPLLLAAAGGLSGFPAGAAAPVGDGHFAMLSKYCVECHNATDWAGGLALDTMAQLQQHLLLRKYDGFMKKGRVRFRGRQATQGF